nr:uncharacterized protein LOC113820843 [Penaeus vannamei]
MSPPPPTTPQAAGPPPMGKPTAIASAILAGSSTNRKKKVLRPSPDSENRYLAISAGKRKRGRERSVEWCAGQQVSGVGVTGPLLVTTTASGFTAPRRRPATKTAWSTIILMMPTWSIAAVRAVQRVRRASILVMKDVRLMMSRVTGLLSLIQSMGSWLS